MVTKVLLALDVDTEQRAIELARSVENEVDGFKVGLELLMAGGVSLVESIVSLGRPVFVDAKLHDIPNTVGRAASILARSGARWISVHASAGESTLRSAAEAAAMESDNRCGILGITVLTSEPESAATPQRVLELAETSYLAGCVGVVSAVAHIPRIRSELQSMETVSPGIRLSGSETQDQRQVATPREAVAAGCDWVVVGRAITDAPRPREAAGHIRSMMQES